MYDGPEKEKIDIDKLVDLLIKNREEKELPEPEQEPESQPETATVAEFIVPGEVEEEPEQPIEASASVSELVFLTEEEPEEESKPEPQPESEPETQPIAELEEEVILPKKQKRGLFGLFGRKEEPETEEEESWNDWGLKPIGHYTAEEQEATQQEAETLLPEPEPESELEPEPEEQSNELAVDEFPAVRAVAETITMPVILPNGMEVPKADEKTRVIPQVSAEEQPASVKEPIPVAESADEQLPDQLSLEEMVRVEDMEPVDGVEDIDPEEAPEVRLQRNREEKVREFTLSGDEEEENEPEEEIPVEEDEPELEDFTSYEDTKSIATELLHRRNMALFTMLLSGVLEAVLLLLTLLSAMVSVSPFGDVGYLVAQLFILALIMGLNYRTIFRGCTGLFTLKPNSDSAPTIAAAVAGLEVLLHFIPGATSLPFGAALAGLLLTLSAVSYFVQAVGVRRNFAFVSYPGDKYAATLIEEENAVQEIGRRAAGTGEASVGYFHRTGFLTGYLNNAYEPHQGDDWSRFATPIALGLCLLVSPFALLAEGGFWGWLTTFVTMVCLSMPVSQLAVQLPLNQCGRVMLSRGGFLVGWKAVRQFGKLDALVVDIADLYPDESMLLHGIKTFSGTHIDEAILTAASLTIRSDGPLAMIFRRIIENKENLLSEVDSLVYEQGMGLSGWVDGRRVFVGNRRLLQNHGIDVPSSDYEARYAKDGRRLVYLSIGGQLSAMFVVSYLPDPEIQDALQDLCRSHVTLLVRSCDPNITTTDLCESFDLDEYYVDVMPAAAGRAYMKLVEQTSDSMPAVMASNGHILGTAWALSVCRSLQVKCLLALVVQAVAAVLGLALCLSWSLSGTLAVFLPLLLMLGAAVMTWLIPLFKRT